MHNSTRTEESAVDTRVITLQAPTRLHFGLLPSDGDLNIRRGGLGVMIDNPRLQMTAQDSPQFHITGLCRDRVERIAQHVIQVIGCNPLPVHIHVSEAPPSHIGFGSGTQLTLGTASLLSGWARQALSADGFPTLLGRGTRSLVGSEGFHRGGLIFDRGGISGDELEPKNTVEQLSLPTSWRWLTVTAAGKEGLSGKLESDAFSSGVSNPRLRQHLLELVQEQILQSAKGADFIKFSQGLSEYGEQCGKLFAHHQVGLYSSQAMAEVANRLKQNGVLGVGQSSWGPTVFGLFPDDDSVGEFIQANDWLNHRRLVLRVSRTNLSGANILENTS